MWPLLIGLLLTLSIGVNSVHAIWDTAGPLTNPAANAICADTGAIGGANYAPRLWISSTAAGVFVFEHRNAANNANIASHIFPVGASANFIFDMAPVALTDNQRIRVRINAAITGSVQCSLFRDY